MLIDLHTHTKHKSIDSALALDVLLAKARLKGLGGVCLTEHNAVWRREDVPGLAESHGILVVRGMEVSTDAGHVLVFGVDKFVAEMMSVHRLAHIVEQEGGVMILAHPWREGDGVTPGWVDIDELFDAVEVINGSDTRLASSHWMHMVSAMGLAGTGGSDAHCAGAVGSCATKFETAKPIRNEVDLVRELKAGNYYPVWLDGPYV